ncbi:uncharacterized protein LOC141855760 [Brevipalpus obovatus]|uniref:uncharacterized protein LOC141855760 n=1 Tax=Brevipalpus obovatus TaxID=246614 RepID=UPI003D9F0980
MGIRIIFFAFICSTLSSIIRTQGDLPVSCTVKPCEKIAHGECELEGENWIVYSYLGRRTCACCKGEKDAIQATGLPGHRISGLFYGDRYKLCETLYIDQVSCFSRQQRDCNYHTAVHRSKFVGCFYCRPRCESDVQCADIERVCAKCRDDQPVAACTEPAFARKSREIRRGNSSLSEIGDIVSEMVITTTTTTILNSTNV